MRALLIGLWLLPAAVLADGETGAPFPGRTVADVIDEFRAAGEPFVYSTNLVTDDLVVQAAPDAGKPLEIVRQILRPHHLAIRMESGVFLVVRFDQKGLQPGSILLFVASRNDAKPLGHARVHIQPVALDPGRVRPGVFEYPDVAPGRYRFSIDADGFEAARRIVDVWPGERTVVAVDLREARPAIEQVSVSASRYEILREIASSRFVLDRLTIRNMPDLGEDPIRVTQRLPGAAASGASAETHFRGGDTGEVGIVLNGQRLFDPYHIRDYQSVFSTIDSRAIEGVEVYTGGFPVQFGNRMSGMVLMESLDALQPRHTEIGLSVFNTSLLTAGNQSDRRWLFSARRGNLDLVIDPQYGTPSYYDVFAEYDFDLSPATTLSINALIADDRVEVILESDPLELERVVSDSRNAQFWMRLENRWSDELSSSTVVSAVAFDNHRSGSLSDHADLVATVFDDRNVSQFGIRQDFTFTRADRHNVRWGLRVRYGDARYRYRNAAEYFGLSRLYPGRDGPTNLALDAAPKGAAYAGYFSDRWKLSARSFVELGLRWDDQTYTDESSDAQLSPRLSIMKTLGDSTELRLSWGRYHQSQEIHELQIEDGVTNFWPAQRADHLIAGIRHLIRDKYSLRVEAFRKDIRQVRPRFENLYNPLALIPEVQPDRVRLDPSSARAAGLEISIDRSGGPLTWWASYVLSEVTDRIAGRDEYRSWDQRHALQGGIGWSNRKWDLSLAGSVHSGWPLTELALAEGGTVALPGPRNAGRHPTFASLDFRVSRRWHLPRGSLMAFLEVSNLTNRRNECCLDFDFDTDPATGNEVFTRGVNYWLPVLPAVGILWEF